MSESKITKQTRDYLKSIELSGAPIYFNKISDKFTSGIPDYQGTFHGISFYIELKDTGKKARTLQEWHLKKAKNAGALVLSTDDFNAVKNFIDYINLNHQHIIMQRYI